MGAVCVGVRVHLPLALTSVRNDERWLLLLNICRTVNVSINNPGGNGDTVHKRLFEHYLRAETEREAIDKYGDAETLRDYFLEFRSKCSLC